MEHSMLCLNTHHVMAKHTACGMWEGFKRVWDVLVSLGICMKLLVYVSALNTVCSSSKRLSMTILRDADLSECCYTADDRLSV